MANQLSTHIYTVGTNITTKYSSESMASDLGTCLLLFLSCGLPVTNGQGLFMLGYMYYVDGETVLWSDIGDTQANPPGNALMCITSQTDCCAGTSGTERRGEFIYPDGVTRVPNRASAGSDGLLRGRGDGFISLQRLSGASMDPPTGPYRCDIPDPDRYGISYDMFINIVSGIHCGSIVCVDDATCMNSNNCTCPTGYTGNGRSGNGGTDGCTDINDCTVVRGSCEDGYNCVNTPGSFLCNDINECISRAAVCVDGATCVNTDGSFTCTCPSGLTGDGRNSGSGCTDINECTNGTADCVDGATCVNTPGSFTCTCPSGLTGDGRDSGSGCTVPLQLIFRGVSYPNNSDLFIGDIGDTSTGSAILCTTNRSPCCQSLSNRFGEWFHPNRSVVPNNTAGQDFFRTRGDDQTIRLNRRNNAQSPSGSFCCELPDNRDVTNRLCVKLVPITIIPSGINTAGEQFQLTCTFIRFIDSTPIFLWTGPPNDSPLPSDTRMVSDVMSSGSTHISTLQFNPLQSSHEGNYTCRVIVGATVEMTSIQINVETAPLTTTSQQNTIVMNGTVGGIIVGVIAGLLVVVILSVAAVIVMVCIFKRKHSTRNRNKDTSFNMAPNTSYGPVKSSKEMVESEYEDMKTRNEVYEEIPQATVTFDLATNVAYGPIQRKNDIIITSGTTLYDEVTTPAAATGESQYEAL